MVLAWAAPASLAQANPADAVPRRYTCGMLVEAVEFGDPTLKAADGTGGLPGHLALTRTEAMSVEPEE